MDSLDCAYLIFYLKKPTSKCVLLYIITTHLSFGVLNFTHDCKKMKIMKPAWGCKSSGNTGNCNACFLSLPGLWFWFPIWAFRRTVWFGVFCGFVCLFVFVFSSKAFWYKDEGKTFSSNQNPWQYDLIVNILEKQSCGCK